jgi:hypothetical protein
VTRASGKVSPLPIIEGHYRTLVDARTGRVHKTDYFVQAGIPVVVGALAVWRIDDLHIGVALAGALAALAGLMGAFLFQLSIQLLTQIAQWADSAPDHGVATSRYGVLLEELSANTAYACVIAIVCAACLVGSAVAEAGWPERLLAGLSIGLLGHLALTLLMVLRRVFLLSQEKALAGRASDH